MAGTGRELEAAGWKWKISPALIGGIAAKESSLGRAACSQWDPILKRSTHYNVFGLASCGASWRPPLFHSWAHVYDFEAHFLISRWPNARTPWDFNHYAAYVGERSCSDCWGSKVAGFMQSLFGMSIEVRYGATQAVA